MRQSTAKTGSFHHPITTAISIGHNNGIWQTICSEPLRHLFIKSPVITIAFFPDQFHHYSNCSVLASISLSREISFFMCETLLPLLSRSIATRFRPQPLAQCRRPLGESSCELRRPRICTTRGPVWGFVAFFGKWSHFLPTRLTRLDSSDTQTK